MTCKSQEQVPVAVNVFLLGPDCDTPYSWLAAAYEFVVWSQRSRPFAAGCTIDANSTRAVLIFVALLTLSKARRFASWVQSWASLASQLERFGRACRHGMSISWYHQRNPRNSSSFIFGDSFGKTSVSLCSLELWTSLNLSHWLACITTGNCRIFATPEPA